MKNLFKCRASGGGALMTNPTGKTNAEKYSEAISKLTNLEEDRA